MAERASPPRRGVVDRVLASWRRPGATMRALLAERPSEATLLSFMLFAGLIAMVGAAAELAVIPFGEELSAEALADQRRAALLERLIGAFVLTPLGIYLGAAIATPILRTVGGSGGYYESRAAFAWTLLATAPLALIAAFVDAAALRMAEGPARTALGVLALGASALALVYWAQFTAAAHALRSPARLLAAVLGLIAALWILSLALKAALS